MFPSFSISLFIFLAAVWALTLSGPLPVTAAEQDEATKLLPLKVEGDAHMEITGNQAACDTADKHSNASDFGAVPISGTYYNWALLANETPFSSTPQN
jgi:hypothetical protein